MKEYDHKKVEKKWQAQWAKKEVYKTEDPVGAAAGKPKFYILDMFPYPSGEGLHVGHPKGYIATDIVSRMKRMQGFNVLHPMGFDAFGLPAENYAIKTKTNPMDSVAKNVARYKKQLEIIGFDYDWSREVNTTDPKFYKWTQWIFLKLLEKGLAYESYEPVNWCPTDKTVLANEDVEDGRCERCGTPVEKRPMRQWVLKITDYADRLLKDLDLLDWPESIKESQRNWIGRSEGAEIEFAVKVSGNPTSEKLKVFTTRPDTLFGVTYVVVAPEQKFVTEFLKQKQNLKNHDEVVKYVAHARMMTEIERTDAKKDKTGVKLDGVTAINPANNEEIPVYVADYVLADYGTGAVMAVPAHDERDFAFMLKYKLPVKFVVSLDGTVPSELTKAYLGNGKLINSGKFTGMFNEDAKKEITESVGGKWVTKYKLKDWVFSRQRYWGEPFPVLFDLAKKTDKPIRASLNFRKQDIWNEILSGKKTVETRALNPEEKDRYFGDIKVGDVLKFVYVDTKGFVLASVKQVKVFKSFGEYFNDKATLEKALGSKTPSSLKELVEIYSSLAPGYAEKAETNGLIAFEIELIHEAIPVPESDLPVELPKVKSYEPTGTGESPLAAIDDWMNVKVGKGKDAKILRRESNTMPQWAGSSWYYLRFMDPHDDKQLVDPKLEKYWNQVDFYVGGAEHATRHLIYARFWHKFLYDIGVVSTHEPFKRLQAVGLIMGEDGRKMSKRFGNVVNPDDIVMTYGADTIRLYEMFMGPFEQAIPWSTSGILGSRRFLERVWNMFDKVDGADGKALGAPLTKEADILLNKTIEKVSTDMAGLRHNTAVSSLMILSNEFEKSANKNGSIPRSAYEAFLKLLAPLAPHMTDELWSQLGNKGSIHLSAWPVADKTRLQDEEATIVVQVNGKVRGSFTAPKTADKAVLESTALALPEVKKWLASKTPAKIIIVPGKLVSIVVK